MAPDLPDWLKDPSRDVLIPLMLPEGKLNVFALACAVTEAVDQGIVPPTLSAFQTLMETDDELVTILNSYYPDPNDGKKHHLGLDTQDREMVTGVLANHFVGRAWPMYGDGPEAGKQFVRDMKVSLEKAGWTYLIDPEKA